MSESYRGRGGALDLVLDIGKTRSKLLVLDRSGNVVAQAEQASGTCDARLGSAHYRALDTDATAQWLEGALVALGPDRSQLATATVSAHGAGVAAIDDDGLAWPVPDYEFEGFDERPADWPLQIGAFTETASPDLPRGLNIATQLDWLDRHASAHTARNTLLPLAQYWSWWLSGVAASELSSLGCHTHLWAPVAGGFSQLAQRRGWAQRFAPLRRAWEVLGPVRTGLAERLGLPPHLRVHVGVHDSNACLARYLRSHPRMTLVTTGTWVVVMAPGAPERELQAHRDQLCNVSVRQERVPTGRFMGGREVQHLCAGADPALANAQDLQALLQRGLMALPGFEPQGGPFRQQSGQVVDAQGPVALATLPPGERATLAALYAAQVTAWIIEHLGGTGPLVVEGPFSHNPVFTGVLAALMPTEPVLVSADALEGTARGAWMLSRWTDPGISTPPTEQAVPLDSPALRALHQRWCQRITSAG